MELAVAQCRAAVQAGIDEMRAKTNWPLPPMGDPTWEDWINTRRGKSEKNFRLQCYENFKGKGFDRWEGTEECRGDKLRVLPSSFAIGVIVGLDAFSSGARHVTVHHLNYALQAVQPPCHDGLRRFGALRQAATGADDCDEVEILWIYCPG